MMLFFYSRAKIIIVLLAVGFLFVFYFSLAQSKSIEELQEDIVLLQEKAELLESQISIYRNNVNERRRAAKTLQNEINIIEGQVKTLRAEIQQSENQISLTNLEIDRLQLQIESTEQNIAENLELIREFVRILNKFDDENSALLLLKVSDLSDFFNQQNYVENLHLRVKETLEKTKSLRDALDIEKQRQENKRYRLADSKDKLSAQKNALSQEENRKDTILRQTKGEEKKFQNLLSEVEKQKAQFLQEIQRLETEVVIQKNFLHHVQAGAIPPKGTKLFIWPEDNAVLTQGFGMTSFAKRGAYGGSPHNGIDIAAGKGSPIKAAASGKVLVKGYNKGWGNWVAIEHQGGLTTLYSHMIKPSHLAVETEVETGDVVGYEGSTGFVTGSHLHFSVYVNFFTFERDGNIYFNYFEGTVNPLDYL